MTTETLYIVIVVTIVIMVLGYLFKYRLKKNQKTKQ